MVNNCVYKVRERWQESQSAKCMWGARFWLGLLQRALCPWGGGGSLTCPLGLPQKKQCALWLHLKTNIFLTVTWTTWTVWALNMIKYFADSDLVVTITTFKMMGVVMRYYLCPLACKFWWEHWWGGASLGLSLWSDNRHRMSSVHRQQWVSTHRGITKLI